MVALFVISVTPTTQTIQRQNLGSSDRLKKAVNWPMILKRIRSVNLKNGNFYPIFVVKICSVRLLTFCVLTVINVYWIRLDELHSDKRIPPPAGVHYYLCVSPSVRAYLCNSWKCYNSWTTWYIFIKLCIILQEIINLLSAYSFWRRILINLHVRSPFVVHITVSWIWDIFAQRWLMSVEPSI